MQRLYNSFRSANINLARKHTKHHQSVEQRAQKAVFEHKLTHSRKFIIFFVISLSLALAGWFLVGPAQLPKIEVASDHCNAV